MNTGYSSTMDPDGPTEDWVVICRPMLVDRQRPEYCGAGRHEGRGEGDMTCPVCPATLSGNDIVGGVCQAIKSGPAPRPLIAMTVERRS